jgi:hypothetical protein
MTTTIPDLILNGVAYQDVYALAGLAPGTPLIIQNKCSGQVTLQISAIAPPASDKDGYILYPYKNAYINDATEGLFAFGKGRIHVAEDVS